MVTNACVFLAIRVSKILIIFLLLHTPFNVFYMLFNFLLYFDRLVGQQLSAQLDLSSYHSSCISVSSAILSSPSLFVCCFNGLVVVLMVWLLF